MTQPLSSRGSLTPLDLLGNEDRAAAGRLEKAERERDRYREALQWIAGAFGDPEWMLEEVSRRAREALDG